MKCNGIGWNLDILNCSSSFEVVWSCLDSFRNSMDLTQGGSYSNRKTETLNAVKINSVSSYVASTLSYHDTNFRFVFLPAPCFSEADLKCYICHSNKSWEECEKDKRIGKCYPGHGEVCVKMHLVEHDDTEKGYKESFVKMCGKAKRCTNKECQEKYKTCKVDCCHKDLCNVATGQTHVTSTLLATVLAVLLCVLQLRYIFWTFYSLNLAWYCALMELYITFRFDVLWLPFKLDRIALMRAAKCGWPTVKRDQTGLNRSDTGGKCGWPAVIRNQTRTESLWYGRQNINAVDPQSNGIKLDWITLIRAAKCGWPAVIRGQTLLNRSDMGGKCGCPELIRDLNHSNTGEHALDPQWCWIDPNWHAIFLMSRRKCTNISVDKHFLKVFFLYNENYTTKCICY